MTIHPIRRAGKPLCACCGGDGRVPAADGELRPCSRCDNEAFSRWADARRPVPPPAPAPEKRA